MFSTVLLPLTEAIARLSCPNQAFSDVFTEAEIIKAVKGLLSEKADGTDYFCGNLPFDVPIMIGS